MIGKLMALLLVSMSVCMYMTKTKIVENFGEDNTKTLNVGRNIEGNPGYHNSPYFAVGPTDAYSAGGSNPSVHAPGPQFITHARLGLNAARGGDAISCTGMEQNECRSDSSCVWTGPGPAGQGGCKNTFDNLNQSFNTQGYLEKQFQNGTMGAEWVQRSKQREIHQQELKRPKKDRSVNDNDDTGGSGVVKPFASNSVSYTNLTLPTTPYV